MSKGKILYIRSGPYELSFDGYNLQEVGLGKAFCELGYDFDIVYYTKSKNRIQIVETNQNELRILWRKGIKLLRSGIYPAILKKNFLHRYDAVIVSEYSQIMSVMVAHKHPNTYIYNGPYYNLFKIPFMEKIYDSAFAKYINNHVKKVFCKTEMSKDYIAKKGIKNTTVVGVGLDPDKFESENEIENNTQTLLNQMKGKKLFLYVGQIIPRKNIELLVKAFIKVNKEVPDSQLILIGTGDKEYKAKCENSIPSDQKKSVIWCPFIKNAQLKYVYEKAAVFLLPSSQEIFGMVLLEAMYFGLPVVSSHSAGGETLIRNKDNGIMIDSLDIDIWANYMKEIILDENKKNSLGCAAKDTIRNNYMWSSIAHNMIAYLK